MPPLYPTEEQARRFLTLWQIQSARKDRAATEHWGAKAAGYLPHLSPAVAAELRAEFGFTQETAS